jgi:exopolysaccharide production protein ExoY
LAKCGSLCQRAEAQKVISAGGHCGARRGAAAEFQPHSEDQTHYTISARQVKTTPSLSEEGTQSNFVSQGEQVTELSTSSLSSSRDNSRCSNETEDRELLNEIPWWKRLLDVSLIFVSLPAWLTGIILISIWIKLFSPGPILFRQERIGYKGKRFTIFKFRTMAVNVETGSHELHLQNLINSDSPMTKLDAAGDPRIIFGGRILRAMGLDELPQIFNVLRKEMSLVGHRPSTVKELQCYKPGQEQRLDALPGLTGYWQVNGKNKTTFSEMIDLDIYYTRNLSLSLDVSILVRTLPTVLGQVIESRFRKVGPKVGSKAMSKNVA